MSFSHVHGKEERKTTTLQRCVMRLSHERCDLIVGETHCFVNDSISETFAMQSYFCVVSFNDEPFVA